MIKTHITHFLVFTMFILFGPFFTHKNLVKVLPETNSGLVDNQLQEMNKQPPELVIFDTDVGGDIDDAGALAVLHALEDMGQIKLLAIGVVNGHKLAVPYVHAVNTWYGKPDLPVGTIKSSAPFSRDNYMRQVIEDYPYQMTKYTAPDVVKLYRKLLASMPDKSVTLIVVGPATNIYNLLISKPDEYSTLKGADLVKKKIKFYAAGGNGSAGLPVGECGFNYKMDLAAASGELRLFPADIPVVYAGGSGTALKIGSVYSQSRPDHIIRKSYEYYFDGIAKDRPTWDQLRVIYGSQPQSRIFWDTSPSGNIQVSKDGLLRYNARPDKNQSYAYIKDFDKLRTRITELMIYDPYIK